VLIFGRCVDLPLVIWTSRAGARTSVITTPAELPELVGVGEHEATLVLGERAPISDWVTMARAVDKVRPVTAVVAFDDRWIPHAAAANEALGLTGHSTQTVSVVHNKLRWRERMRAAGVEDVPAAKVNDPGDITAFGAQHGWPLIVKPARGTGSLGVSKIDSPRGAAAALARARAGGLTLADGVLVEPFLNGTHVIVNTFAEDGEYVVVAMSSDCFTPPTMVDLGYVLPAPIEPADETAAGEHVVAALRAVGARHGPASTEVRLTADGPRTIECQLRLDGANVPRVIQTILGIDLPALWMRQLVGDRVLPKLRRQVCDRRRPGRAGATWWAYPDADGTLRSIEGLERAGSAHGVGWLDVRAAPGDRVRRLAGADDRVVQVFAEHEDPSAAIAAARRAAEQISFVVSTFGRPASVE
jgi:biotin carboxylase